MKNIKKSLKEELLESLPEYINGEIYDSKLNDNIRLMIESDYDFKNEYEEMKNSLNFLGQSEFVDTPPNYFNNLSVKINKRIDEQITEKVNFGFMPNLNRLWKIFIPAVTIILIILYFAFSQTENKPLLTEQDTEKISTPENIQKNDSKEKNQLIPYQDIISEKNEEPNLTKQNRITDRGSKDNQTKVKQFSNIENNITKNNNIKESSDSNGGTTTQEELNIEFLNTGIADIFELTEERDSDNSDETEDIDLLNSNNSEDINLQEEFRNLSPDEQQEILKTLKETQI